LIPEDVPTTAEQCDQLISAEIPDKEGNPELFETVVSTMLHTKCDGSVRRPLGCKQDSDVCSKSFPKPAALETQLDVGGFPSYRRRCLRTFRKDGTDYDDQWVVPYNPFLSQKYNCHINVELCVTIQAIKYLYKYVYKGNDRAQVDIAPENGNSTHEPVRDEIKQFVDARYVCPPEAMWHILGFKIHHEYPKHIRLQVHLEDEQLIYFKNSADPTTIQQRPARSTTLTSWFTYNRESNDETSRSLLYPDFPRKYTFDNNHRVWRPRRRDIDSTLGRMHYVPILKGETYYLRMLLNKIPGATCYEDMRTVRRTVHRSFKEAAIALGLLQSDNDLSLAIAEAATYSMPSQLRRLFCSLIIFCEPTSIADLWITHRFVLSEDYLYQYNLNMDPAHRLQEPTESMYGMALLDLEDELAQHSRSIKGIEGIDFPVVDLRPTTLVLDERFTDSRILRDHGSLITSARELPPIDPQEFNASQLMVFDRIIAAIDGSPLQAKVFFVDGPGGTGKTFLFSKLLQYVRQSNNIAIAVASSGAAATLLPGGRTAHSTFGIPLKVTSSSSITLKPRSQIADVIRRANIIVWDECSMIDINAFEFVDRTLKDIMKQNDPLREHVPFGGKLIAFGGDFRQVLPVVRTAGRSVIVSHCINRSPLWKHVISLSLTINMRVQQAQVDDDPILANELAAFSDYLLQIGRGETHDFPGITSPDFVQLDQNMVLPTDSLTPLLNFVFPTFQGANYTRSAILTPKNKDVDRINNVVITELFEGEIIEKYSSDTYINQDEEARFSLEHINDVVYGGIPPHVLKLKIGCPVTLIRNLNPRQGLCNGTRLICNDVQDHVIRATVLTGSHIGDTVFIPRIEFISDDEHCPIQFKRRQFPIKLAFSLTINKAQGQTLDRVGIFLPDHVFSHGQLYVALSRARQASAIKISINRDVSITFNQPDSNPCRYTKNVVYSEVYQSPYTSRQQILQQHTSSTQ
jgi:hypothetical protein